MNTILCMLLISKEFLMVRIYDGVRKLPVARGLTGRFILVPGQLAAIIRLSLMMQI